MTAFAFGDVLRRLRVNTIVSTVRQHGSGRRTTTGPLSMNELGRRAGCSAGYVLYLERGSRPPPQRRQVEQFAVALDLDPAQTAVLLAAAGYWPWLDADGDTAELIVAAGAAIVNGDWRRVAGGDS
jgi:transcriptional regulator with XRE-family HTH domain